MTMAQVLHSILFSSIVLLSATPATSSSQSPLAPISASEPLGSSRQTPPAPSSVAEPLGSTPQIPPAPLPVAEPLRPTLQSPPAPSPGSFISRHVNKVRGPEFNEQDVETNGFSSVLDGKQKAGVVLMLMGGSGLLVYGGFMLHEKIRQVSSRRRRFGSLGQPRKLWM